ncbi:MAG: glycosyltransferase, partial [Bacteroidia bacterium]|nr:glycosyltransferase [Bacteroidia bacterium]
SKFSNTDKKVYSPHPMYATYGSLVDMKDARNKLELNENEKIVLFFGLIRHYKGLDILIEAFADEKVRQQNIKLLVAGEFYEDKQPYLNLIAKHNLQGSVILHDSFIANDMVRYYFCASNLVAQTYRNATNSGVTMVGYYYNKPMLVTNVGGLAEIVPHNQCGYTVPLNTNEIAGCLVDFFKNNREKEMVEHVKHEKIKYEWSTFINSLLELYNRC